MDLDSEINGFALETLVLQNIKAMNDFCEFGYEIFYWHTRNHQEVDLVLYGKKRLLAIEVKSSYRLRPKEFQSLQLFKEDYPMAETFMIYAGQEEKTHQGIRILPAKKFFSEIEKVLAP